MLYNTLLSAALNSTLSTVENSSANEALLLDGNGISEITEFTRPREVHFESLRRKRWFEFPLRFASLHSGDNTTLIRILSAISSIHSSINLASVHVEQK